MAEMNQKNGMIVDTVVENGDTTTIFFKPEDSERFKAFRPGQFATIRVMTDEGWSDPHPFTISGAPGDTLRMTIKRKGHFTDKVVPHLKAGIPIQCAGPYGAFCRDIEGQEQIVFVAGGVGITPFLSVLRHFRNTAATNNIVLFWCNRTYANAFAAAELEEMAKELKLTVVHILSREHKPDLYEEEEKPQIRFEKGHFSREMLERHIKSTTASFYLCGPGPMQEHVLEEMAAYGIAPESVAKELFVFEK
ncbi:FAD/NAD-binding family oxidoreductase [Oleidesulfovibrio sp.]|uniref:FAD/NAD-binding family oxidoreductase n=1 Tax=Oleidesulfovibrio sp. TaxID=2909707 RepID=UPI003A89D175